MECLGALLVQPIREEFAVAYTALTLSNSEDVVLSVSSDGVEYRQTGRKKI